MFAYQWLSKMEHDYRIVTGNYRCFNIGIAKTLIAVIPGFFVQFPDLFGDKIIYHCAKSLPEIFNDGLLGVFPDCFRVNFPIEKFCAICQRANWYFIGYCHDKKEPRMFPFSRVRNVKLTKLHFRIPDDFKSEAYFDKEMGVFASAKTAYTVELLINNEIGTYAFERQWHETQKVEQREDGSVYVKFTTTQMPEVLRWVLGQGHTVKILNPPELIGMVKDETEKVRGMYA